MVLTIVATVYLTGVVLVPMTVYAFRGKQQVREYGWGLALSWPLILVDLCQLRREIGDEPW